MKVTEKCDVYSFGILAMEIIYGKHPGDFITDLASPAAKNIQLRHLLDDRLLHPTPEIENVLISIIELARVCLNENYLSRPTMQIISKLLLTGAPFQQHLGK